ncbi:MAG: CPBP family intramembrane metalloprotease [bacterium]|nr:CPBP family intramembrane metalloprotease [bacterium]
MISKKDLIIMCLVNIPVAGLYYLIYTLPGMRPYGNMAYFACMLTAGYFLGKGFDVNIKNKTDKKVKTRYLALGVSLMLFLYLLMRISFSAVGRIPKLQGLVDLDLWQYFVRPWHEINIFVSVSGVIMIVIAVEMFYRVYVQNIFNLYFDNKTAILLASIISGARACTLGPVSGLVDFSLAFIWGWIYFKSGFWPAVITHIAWDVFFVYFPAP